VDDVRRRPRRQPEQHGTLDAWHRHQVNGSQPCDSCEIAREFTAWLTRRARIARGLRELIGVIAGAAACPADCGGQAHDRACWPP
jgi:hypothetical protein